RGARDRAAGRERSLVPGAAGVAVRRILFLAQAEVLHIVRDRILLAQTLIVPMVQLVILSNAAPFEIHNTPIQVVDFDRTSASRGVVNRLAANGHFEIVDTRPSLHRDEARLLDGSLTRPVVIPRDFEESLVKTGMAPVELSVNGEKGSAAGIVQAYATRVLIQYAHDLQPSNRVRAAAPRIDVRTRSRYNPTLNYKYYMVPGILVALMTIIGSLLSAQNIAREKELGTLEQLNVTPITRGEFSVANLLPFWLLGWIELSLGLLIGTLVFGIPVRGSLPLLYAVAGVYLAVAVGIGLWCLQIVGTLH